MQTPQLDLFLEELTLLSPVYDSHSPFLSVVTNNPDPLFWDTYSGEEDPSSYSYSSSDSYMDASCTELIFPSMLDIYPSPGTSSPISPVPNSHKIYLCPENGCDRTFDKYINLKSHKRSHLNSAPHSCEVCNSSFKRRSDLSRHVKSVHAPDEEKAYACDGCMKRYGRADALRKHMKSCAVRKFF